MSYLPLSITRFDIFSADISLQPFKLNSSNEKTGISIERTNSMCYVLMVSCPVQYYRFLRGIERFELEKNHAEMLKNIVQWFYIEITDVGQNLVKYTPLLNFWIEKAFKDQQPSHQFKDSEGVAYIVDFAAMEEYPEDNKEDTVKVIRRDLIKGKRKLFWPNHINLMFLFV